MVVPIVIHISAILSVHMYTPALTPLRVACYTSKPIAYKLVYLITAIPQQCYTYYPIRIAYLHPYYSESNLLSYRF